MIHHFDHLGVVVVRDGPKDTDLFPSQIEVEDWHKDIKPDSADEAALNEALMAGAGALSAPSNSATGVRRGAARSAADVDLRGIEKVRRFPGGFRP